MTTKSAWPDVLRTFHLPGGLRVDETGPGKAVFGPLQGELIVLEFDDYGSVGNEVRQRIGLPILGIEFCRDQDEVDGFSQPEWQPIVPKIQDTWPTKIAERIWSGLSNAARERGDSHLFLVTGSIVSQCRFSAMRLLDLSNLYTIAIKSILRSNLKSNEEMREYLFRDSFSDNIFSSIHAEFFEISALRDYYAEYISLVVYNQTNIDSFNSLNNFIKKNSTKTPLEIEIDAVYENESGWLRQFTMRRNTLAHRMPFDRLAGAGFLGVRRHEIKHGMDSWLLHISIPDPLVKSHKSTFKLPIDIAQQINKMTLDLEKSAIRDDTLSYLFQTFEQLLDFGNRLRSTFPYEPKMVTLTDADIISVTLPNGSVLYPKINIVQP